MGLLDGGGAALMSAVFSGVYLDGSLYREQIVDDGEGGGTIGFGDAEPIKLQMEAATEAMRQAEGYTAEDVRFLVLAQGVTRPLTSAQLGFDGTRYAIVGPVGRDPCGACWDIHARPIGDDDAS